MRRTYLRTCSLDPLWPVTY
ncbi:unnamed protein product, partial [Didymodactylos carnosus]